MLSKSAWYLHNPQRRRVSGKSSHPIGSSAQTTWNPPLHPLPCLSLLRFSSLLFHPQSPIPFPEQENVPPACCANPPMTEGLLIPIEVESDDAEGSGEVEESTMGRVDEEAVPQLWRNNQSRAAGQRVVRASNLVHPHPYAHAKGLGDFWARRARFLR